MTYSGTWHPTPSVCTQVVASESHVNSDSHVNLSCSQLNLEPYKEGHSGKYGLSLVRLTHYKTTTVPENQLSQIHLLASRDVDVGVGARGDGKK